MVFVPAIVAETAVVVVIKEVHIVVQIKAGCAQLRTTALRSPESTCVSNVIKQILLIRFDRDHAVVPGSGSVGSEGDEISPITIDRGGRHIGEVVAAAMYAVHRQKASDATLPPVRANPL